LERIGAVLKYSWIPKRGLLQNVEPFDCPADGLTYCRNFNYGRKDGTLTRSKGKEKFTATAAANGTSIRGIGVLDSYANPDTYPTTNWLQIAASTDDVQAAGATDFTTDGKNLKAGSIATTAAYTNATTAANDIYVDNTAETIHSTEWFLRYGGRYDTGIRFANVAVDPGITITKATLKVYQLQSLGESIIYAERTTNAAAWSDYSNFAGRTATSAYTAMSTGFGWTTYDITTAVQEVLNIFGWISGNAMAFLLKATTPAQTAWSESVSTEGGRAAILTISAGSQIASHIGLYFAGFDSIDSGDTIQSAHIKTIVNSRGNAVNEIYTQPSLRIYGHLTPMSTTFTDRTDWNARQSDLTAAYVDWTPNPNTYEPGDELRSPDITTVIQEIVDQATWNDDDDGDLSLFIKDNGTGSEDTFLDVFAYDYLDEDDNPDTTKAPILELETESDSPTEPKFYFWTADQDDAYLYEKSDPATALDQGGITWAHEKQNMIIPCTQFKDADYTFNYLLTSDRLNYPQKLDRVAEDTATTSLTTDLKYKHHALFQRRLFAFNLVHTGTRFEKSYAWTTVTDPTAWDTTNDIAHLPGSDEGTGMGVMKNVLNLYSSGSIWYSEYYPNDTPPFSSFCHTPEFGHLGANIARKGNVHFILTHRGIGAYRGGDSIEIISDGIKTDLDHVLRGNLASLTYMRYHPVYDELWVAHPVEGFSRNMILSRGSLKYGTWSQDERECNVLAFINDPDDNWNQKMVWGGEDGYLWKEGTEENDGSAFSGSFISGPLYLAELANNKARRNRVHLNELHVWQNQELSTGLKVYLKSGDYPWEWDTVAWSAPFSLTDDPKIPVDQHGAWFAVRVESLNASEKSSVSQIDFYFEDTGEEYK
jgi:hypothetical protein